MENNLIKGFSFGVFLSIPLWLSFFGWVKLIISIVNQTP
jgi:hypothetical protein